MATRKITITIEGEGDGADTALDRLLKALAVVTVEESKQKIVTVKPSSRKVSS